MSATILENTDFDSVQNSGRLLIGNTTFEVEVDVEDIFDSNLIDSRRDEETEDMDAVFAGIDNR